MWLIDVYRVRDKLVLWINDRGSNIRVEKHYNSYIYSREDLLEYSFVNKLDYQIVNKKDVFDNILRVIKIKVKGNFEAFIRDLEKAGKHRIVLYDCDVKPEQRFFYENNLVPFCEIDENFNRIGDGYFEDYKITKIELKEDYIVLDGKRYCLENFAQKFKEIDPDVILMKHAFRDMPKLYQMLKERKIECRFNRWDNYDIMEKGGRCHFSYGDVKYMYFPVRLRGRLLIDTSTTIGGSCDFEGILELAILSGNPVQQIASRSFGAVFQSSLVREIVKEGKLVSYKEKPIEEPISMFELLKCDRTGHTMDPLVGFHKDVAEIDFTSMFPFLIHNKNISADCMLTDKGPFEKVANTPFRISRNKKGLIPRVLKPFLERRIYYKNNPGKINDKKNKALKMVLVSCYGYLRFREFKLGIPTSHMAICAYAREMILDVVKLAEERGFEVVHSIVDSVYLKKKDIDENIVRDFCREVEERFGIPMDFVGIFRWIVLLSSINDSRRALPSTYYGVFKDGKVKVRGIEVRQKNQPAIVKIFQGLLLDKMKSMTDKSEVRENFYFLSKYLRVFIREMKSFDKQLFVMKVRVGKKHYSKNISQKIIIEKLRCKGVKVNPGNSIEFFYSVNGPALIDEDMEVDHERYRNMLQKAMYRIMQPFGFSYDDIIKEAMLYRQLTLEPFCQEEKVLDEISKISLIVNNYS